MDRSSTCDRGATGDWLGRQDSNLRMPVPKTAHNPP